MPTDKQSFAGYENPPLIEVACGIQFQPLAEFLTPHVGLLWQKFKDNYPYCEEVAPIPSTIEILDESPNVQLTLSNIPPFPRIWFLDELGNNIIQVQRDRFLHNWRRMQPHDIYPGYHSVFQNFQTYFSQFEHFLQEVNLKTVIPLRYELIYVNHIYQGEGWNNLKDINQIFPNLYLQIQQDTLSDIEAIDWQTILSLPDEIGRLRVSISSGISQEDQKQLLLFQLSVRGLAQAQSKQYMIKWFNKAHEYIIKSLITLTGEDIQKNLWRLRK